MSYLEQVKKDLFQILEKAPWEAYSVRQAVVQGKINGSTYSGECCCIKGIIANNVGLGATPTFEQAYGILMDGTDASPLEGYIERIRPGHTPVNNEKCQQLLVWLDEFIAEQEAKQADQIGASVQAGLAEVLAAVELPITEEAVPELVQV